MQQKNQDNALMQAIVYQIRGHCPMTIAARAALVIAHVSAVVATVRARGRSVSLGPGRTEFWEWGYVTTCGAENDPAQRAQQARKDMTTKARHGQSR